MDIVLEAVEHRAIGVDTLIRPDETVDTIRRVMVDEVGIEQKLRRDLIDHIAVFGADDDLIGQQVEVATQDQGVMREETCQTLRQLVRTHVDIVQFFQFISFAIHRGRVQRNIET